MKKIIWAALFLTLLLPVVSSAHYIVGYVEDAKNGEPANDKTILIWHHDNLADNLLDVVGPSGNSGVENTYMLDCEMLSSPCTVGDTLSVKIIDNGDGYVSETKNVTVTGFGYTLASNITVNSPPESYSLYPSGKNLSANLVNINCSANDLDGNLGSVTLYGNWSGGWHANETKSLKGFSNTSQFIKYIPDGSYKYSCKATDNLSVSSPSISNYSFLVDTVDPIVNSFSLNTSFACGTSEYVRASCSAFDSSSGIDEVIIESKSPTGIRKNHSTTEFSVNNYYSDIILDELGQWSFSCFVNDTAGNSIVNLSENLTTYSQNAEIKINDQFIILENKLIEGETAHINVTIKNDGCGISGPFKVSFFEDNVKSIENKTVNIEGRKSENITFSWIIKIGNTDLNFFADYDEQLSEPNESNNRLDEMISVTAWQHFYGNLSVDKILGTPEKNITLWFNQENVSGNIFIVNKQSNIDWFSLHAIGRKTDGSVSSDDFITIDNLLEMTDLNDSIVNTFTSGSSPKNTTSFTVHQKEITSVPVINSSLENNFLTGILWDSTKDTNGYFDSNDKEDIIFASKVSSKSKGIYGIYDYEISVPALLREYYPEGSDELYFYYELD